jgi:DNA replication protein DnaC
MHGLGQYECAVCEDLGYVRMDVPVGDPRFGRLMTCPACGAGAALRRQAAEARTGRYCVHLPEKDFGDFKARGGVVDTALAAAQRFAESPARCMVLWGPPGTGKTHLVAAAANAIRARGEDVGFFTAPDLLDLLRSGYDKGDYEALLDALKNIKVLVLDDLGAERGTAWAEEKLFQVINHRYNKRLALLVAMNPDPATLEERIADRLCDVDWCLRVHVTAPSWRRRNGR